MTMTLLIGTMVATPFFDVDVSSQVIGPPTNVPGISKPVRVIRGVFTSDVTLTNDVFWVLRGTVFFRQPARLFVQAGTTIVGELATRGTLVIDRGAQIIADGTREQPIVFTSDQRSDERTRGDWGGLILNGRAPVNSPTGVFEGEGDTGEYGGTNPDDNSGILRFVRVEFAGIEFSPDNELNGIAFQGVGRGTIVDHVQVSFNKDDGIEMFGGTVEIKHAVLTNCGDDSIDWTFGWQGRLQFAIAQHRADDADRALEADNNASNNELLPRSNPTIFNITLIGDPSPEFGNQSLRGFTLREGTAGTIRNFIVMGFKDRGVEVATTSTMNQVTSGALSLGNGIFFMNNPNVHSSAAQLVAHAGGTIRQVNPELVDPFNRTSPDFRPLPGSPALVGATIPPNDGFFEAAMYLGALDDDPEHDWTRGWTNFEQPDLDRALTAAAAARAAQRRR
jgi:hypothetical protein